MGDAGAGDDGGVAEEGGGGVEVVEEGDPGAEEDGGEVDGEFVEEAGVEELPDGVGSVDADVFSGGGGFGLGDGVFDAIGDEVDGRAGAGPSGGDVVGEDEGGPPSVVAAPALSFVEGAAAGEDGAETGPEAAEVGGGGGGDFKGHGVGAAGGEFDVTRGEVPVEDFVHAVIGVGDEAVEGHGHDGDEFGHGGGVLSWGW